MKYDFGGWATRNDILCTDGRTIRKDAFKECDGCTVPLVWNHQHNDPENVLGHAVLENRDEGVYAYCSFNDTRKAQSARMAVDHGDVDSLSIYANRLKQNGGNVLHGVIKEVSLVLAGANAGAHIDEVIRHGEICEDEFIIYNGEMLEIEHADKEDDMKENEQKTEEVEETVADVFNTLTDKQKQLVFGLINKAAEEEADTKTSSEEPAEEPVEHADKAEDDETVGDVFDTLTEKQKKVVYALIALALKEGEAKQSDEDGEIIHSEESEGGSDMHNNVFESNNETVNDVLTHSEQEAIFADAKRLGSLKDAVLQHGITNIGYAYPDNKLISNKPEYIKEDQGWVTKVLNGVHHTPFSRIRSLFADLTPDNARAKGYLAKGTEKIEETIALLKRETDPTTVYKLQKIDRDDLLDITDFDMVAWLREEMKLKLNEELARAYLIGDGRGVAAADKINPEKIRPIWTMEDIFVVNSTFEVAADATADDVGKALVKAAVKGFDDYDGSGSTILFIAPDMLSTLLLLEDSFGHRLYKTKAELAAAMLVDDIVPVPPMKNKTRTVTVDNVDHTRNLAGITVDLRDYNVGMDKGGQVSMFDDFNIDYNKMEYLIETRQSGSLVKPKSAIILEYEVAAAQNDG